MCSIFTRYKGTFNVRQHKLRSMIKKQSFNTFVSLFVLFWVTGITWIYIVFSGRNVYDAGTPRSESATIISIPHDNYGEDTTVDKSSSSPFHFFPSHHTSRQHHHHHVRAHTNKVPDSSNNYRIFDKGRQHVVATQPTTTTMKRTIDQALIHEPIAHANTPDYDHNDGLVYIYLDWPIDDRFFTVDNYKALESILTIYPTASIKCLLPTPRDVFSHKIGNILSINQFIKYKKMGYDISMVPVVMKKRTFTSSYGEEYREKWFQRCCQSCNAECRRQQSDHTQPYHLLTYIRLSAMWQRGGIFSDFSFFFLAPLNSSYVQQGYYINSFCGNKHHLEQWQLQSQTISSKNNNDGRGGGGGGGVTSSNDCVTSTLLAFNYPRSTIILCVLRHYEDEKFLDCIEKDTIFGGSDCVKAAFDECFKKYGAANELFSASFDVVPTLNSGSSIGSDQTFSRRQNSMFFKENHDKSRDKSITKAIRMTMTEESEALEDGVLESFDDNAFRASNRLLSNTNWVISGSKRVLWLGSLAFSGSWWNYPYKPGSMLQIAVEQLKLHPVVLKDSFPGVRHCSRFDPQQQPYQQYYHTNNKYHNNNFNNKYNNNYNHNEYYNTSGSSGSSSSPAESTLQLSSLSSSSSSIAVLISTSKSNSGKNTALDHIDETIVEKPSQASFCNNYRTNLSIFSSMGETDLSYWTGMEQLSCAPTVFIAGFMKSASSFLFQALSQHPIILPALRGSQYKETQCYSYDKNKKGKLLDRMWCFPFVEQSQPFLTMDGSITYNLDPQIPKTIKEENPQAKVIFVVRHPVDRLYSNFKFSFSRYSQILNNIMGNRYNKTSSSSTTTTTSGVGSDNEIDKEDQKVEGHRNSIAIGKPTSRSIGKSGSTVTAGTEGAAIASSSFDEFILQALNDETNKFAVMRKMVINGTSLSEISQLYYNKHIKFEGPAGLGSLFIHSLYLPSISHYLALLGSSRVKVVRAEDLDVHNPQRLEDTLNGIYEFLDICPTASSITSDLVPTLSSRNSIPGHFQMSQDMYNKLNKFFTPFNDALGLITGLNFTAWNNKQPSTKLPLYSPAAVNQYHPELWYEKEDRIRQEILSNQAIRQKGVLHWGFHKLLPQRYCRACSLLVQ